LIILTSRTGALLPIYAEPLAEDTRKLLEQSLSIVELDREIERISGLKGTTQAAIDRSSQKLSQQEIAIAVQREKAGRVLRAYYMGYKDFWLSALMNANSLPELIQVWDTMDMIIRSDNETMNSYSAEYQALKKGYSQLQHDKDDLAAVERQLIAQRERVIALQQELDQALAASNDEQMLLRLMDELQAYWKNVGLYEVKQHFRALANAMSDLPDYIQKRQALFNRMG